MKFLTKRPVYKEMFMQEVKGSIAGEEEGSWGCRVKGTPQTWRSQARRPEAVGPASVESPSSSAAGRDTLRWRRYSARSRGPISSAAATGCSAARPCVLCRMHA